MDWNYIGQWALSVLLFAPGVVVLTLWLALRPFGAVKHAAVAVPRPELHAIGHRAPLGLAELPPGEALNQET